ncbi:organic cation/carnitine transporter 2-like [Iris pallida]|uniref:H(+)/Pi cotransporter n=1 Tax=Iris pallida TaxID=29817 RepID=A0AAX6DNF5_IRIPA|nr:organic cation/carnitine transporter 2-like [Iris pallida]
MADQTPLLSTYSSETAPKKQQSSAADHTIESCIGPTGPRQLLQALLVSAAWAFDAQQTFVSVFTDAEPNWHCTNATSSSPPCPSAPCSLPPSSWAWDQPKEATIVSDFGLQCSSPFLAGLPASAFFAGCLAGGLLLATLADSRLGRKNMLVLSCLTMSLAAALTALSPNLWAYSALRFVCGFGRATVGTCAIVLANETVGRRWRDRISIVGFFFFTLGFLSLPGMAYLGRGSSWRSLYIWTSVPSFVYSVAVYLLATESPRWLLVRGRRDEAIELLKSIAASNGNDTIVTSSSFSALSIEEEDWNVGTFSSMRILWEKKWALRRLTAVMVVGFGVGMVYYGMPLNVGNLGSDLYLSVALNAVAELPSSLVIFFVIGRLRRRRSLLALTTASGACSALCAVLAGAGGPQMAAELVSFCGACTAFNVLLIYSIELFPTCVRNSAMSMVRQALVLGGVFAPLLVAAGRRTVFLSFGVFGLVIGCCGLFAASLPETRGGTMSDTLEEEEHKDDDIDIGTSP